jgi:sugar phosphate isomerase/epimerase
MRYGLMSSAMPGPYEDVIRNAGEIGFDGVELDVGADYQENLLWRPEGRAEIGRLLSQAGLELTSVCLGTFWTYSFANPDAAVRERARGFTRDAVAWCAELGARLILVPITPGAEGEDQAAARAMWIEELKTAAPYAEEKKVRLAVENVGRGSGRTADALLEITAGVDSPYVQVYYDFGNGLMLAGDPVREIEKLGSRIAQVHAKDPKGEYMGEGQVDMAAVKAALGAVGYDGYLVLETPATDDPVAAATRNLEFLKEHF